MNWAWPAARTSAGMRSFIAAMTAVTFLANVSLAKAAEGPTTPVAGYCVWSPDPVLTELSVLLDDADCASLNAIPTDPRVEIAVSRTPIFKGERAFGQPSLVHEQSTVVIYADPYADRIAPLAFVKEQYRSFKDAMESYDKFAGSVGDRVGQFHASYMTIGPRWAKDADAALVSALVRMNINGAALGPSLVLLPEAVIEAPGHILSGASRTKEGIETGHYDEAALGFAEVCGGVAVLASLAGPVAKGFIGRTTPISPFHGRVVPTLEPVASVSPLASAPPVSPAIPQLARPQLKGQGPVAGVIEVSDRFGSTKAFKNYNPPKNAEYQYERTIEFIYDPTTKRFATGRPKVSTGSPHETLVRAVGAEESTVAGGTLSRGPNGEIWTNEASGHYWMNWTPETRAEFVQFLEDRTGIPVVHTR